MAAHPAALLPSAVKGIDQGPEPILRAFEDGDAVAGDLVANWSRGVDCVDSALKAKISFPPKRSEHDNTSDSGYAVFAGGERTAVNPRSRAL